MEEDGPAQEAKELLRCVSETLPTVLRRVDLASGALPSLQDFHFYNNFKQFREPVQRVQDLVAALLGDVASSGIVLRGAEWPADEDESYSWFVGFQDEVLERVDCAIDEFTMGGKVQSPALADPDMGFQRVAKRRPRVAKYTGTEAESGNVRIVPTDKKGGNQCPLPFHVRSLPRPQDKFDVPVDNSNTPFKHPPTFRREVDISGSKLESESTQNIHNEANESQESFHPLEEKLRRMDYVDNWLVDVVEPKQPRSMSETPFTMVDSLAALKNVAAKLLCECEIAVDLENHQYRSFQGFTCLMQISTRLEDFIVDTLELRSFIGPYLCDIFANPNIQKVMHGADWDITWLQRDFGIYVCNLFDTGQASRVLEMESYGLAYLLESFCGVHPDKRYQRADWRIRPLPQEMLKYAREDTHYLLYVHDVLKQKLIGARHDRMEVHDPLLEVYKRSRDLCLKRYEKELLSEKSYLKVYGLLEKQFGPEQLAVLAGLHAWRDNTARVEDESTGYILPNHLLLKIAEKMPDRVRKLCSMISARHSFVARNALTLCEIICESRKQCLTSMPVACHSVMDKEKQSCDIHSSIQEEKVSSVTEGRIHEVRKKAQSSTIRTSLVNDARDDCNMSIVDTCQAPKNLSDGEQIDRVTDDRYIHLKKRNERYRQSEVISLSNITSKQDVIDSATQQAVGALANLEVNAPHFSPSSTSDNINDCAATKAKVDFNSVVLRRAPMSSFFGNSQQRDVFGLDSLDHRKSMAHDSSFRDLEFMKNLLGKDDRGGAHSDGSKQPSLSRRAELKGANFLHEEQSTVVNGKSPCKVSKVVTGHVVESVCPKSQHSPTDNSYGITGLIEKQETLVSSVVPGLSFSGPSGRGRGSSYIQVAKSPPGGLASMLAPVGRHSIKKDGTSIHNIQQVKEKLKVDQIKSSVALPFHAFSGINDDFPSQNIQDHHEMEPKYSNKEQNIDHCQTEGHEIVSPGQWETSPSEYEDIIPLETEINAPGLDSVNEKIAIFRKDERSILSNSSDDKPDAITMDLPLFISKSHQQAGQEENEWQTSVTSTGLKDITFGEMHRIHNKGRQSSEKRDYIKKQSNRQVMPTLRTDYISAAGQEKETQGLREPLDCADARKCMEFQDAVSFSNLYEEKEVPNSGKENMFSGDGRNTCFQRSETAFEPPRLVREEFRLEGIQPVERNQLYAPCLDSEERNDSFVMAARSKGISISSTGKHHRGWWPCIVDSIRMLPNNIEDQATRTDRLSLPLPISELHWQSGQERKQWQAPLSLFGSKSSSSGELRGIHEGWRTSEKRGHAEDEKSCHPLHTYGIDYAATTRQREQMQAPWEPYNYAAAKKLMEFDTAVCFRDLFEERDEPNHGKGQLYRKGRFQSSETAFDPLRKFSEEIGPQGIQPAKRRQVFPQSGNRTGIFK